MMTFKKMMAKRALKKNAKEIQSIVKRTYKDVSKDLSKRVSGMRMPLKVTVSR
jgi:hypothetical protein